MVTKVWIAAVISILLSILIYSYTPNNPAKYIKEKQLAVDMAQQARDMIGDDIIGVDYTDITTTLGHKDAKILSTAPDFPALIVQWLKDAGIKEGDTVAINASGSFPALNIAAISAVDAIGAKPILISSLGSSSWGANRPDLTWLHMESILMKKWKHFESVAVSLGGDDDVAKNINPDGMEALFNALKLTSARLLTPETVYDITSKRIAVWEEYNNGELPSGLINVGGNAAFWGTNDNGDLRTEGLLLPSDSTLKDNGVGAYFISHDKPIIHLLGIKKIAAQYQITAEHNSNSPLWKVATPPFWWRVLIFIAVVLLLYIAKPSGQK